MSRLTVTPTPLSGLHVVQRQPLEDARGSFTRVFCQEELAQAGWTQPIAQINHTITLARGTVRGLHYQKPPHAEMKLVTCLRGEVWDVVVDLRAGSPTFLAWHAERLSSDNGRALLIPRGCAHGFQAMEEHTELLYCHSAPYVAESEAGLHPQDPRVGVAWPLPVAALSPRDASHPSIDAEFKGVRL